MNYYLGLLLKFLFKAKTEQPKTKLTFDKVELPRVKRKFS